jgi:hypothetical protein
MDFLGSFVYKGRNITVDSPLVETEKWLKKHEKSKTSVDVETYHILKALKEAKAKNLNMKILPGVFTSDVLGAHPLVEKISGEEALVNIGKVIKYCYDELGIRGAEK